MERQVAELNGRILLVDDQPSFLDALTYKLSSLGNDDHIACQDSREVITILRDQLVDVVCLDLSMPSVSGDTLLPKIVNEFPDVPVLMMAGMESVETAVSCMRMGAHNYLTKPIRTDELDMALLHALDERYRRIGEQGTKSGVPVHFEDIVTGDRQMIRLLHDCTALSKSRSVILIQGETGVGKDMLARGIHRASGRSGRFVGLNAAGLDDQFFSDTLFGHCRGAFSGAGESRSGLVDAAAGGTLFLDEIGDLGRQSQVKLLRLVENGEYLPIGSDEIRQSRARLVVASHRNLQKAVAEGRFREDLYYRLQMHTVTVPPLRERRDDIAILFKQFLKDAADEFSRPVPICPKELLTLLQNYPFPGNIRELRALVFDAVGRHQGGVLSSRIFRQRVCDSRLHSSYVNQEWTKQIAQLPKLKEAAQSLVREALERSNGNQRMAAKILGITPSALNQRLKRI